jgi:hypothetical protein
VKKVLFFVISGVNGEVFGNIYKKGGTLGKQGRSSDASLRRKEALNLITFFVITTLSLC